MEEKFCEAILIAARLREKSFDGDAARAERKMREQANPDGFPIIDYKKFYRKTIAEAAEEACVIVGFDNRMGNFIYLLLTNSWNDAISTVNAILPNKRIRELMGKGGK